jgi:hypothetical protein
MATTSQDSSARLAALLDLAALDQEVELRWVIVGGAEGKSN